MTFNRGHFIASCLSVAAFSIWVLTDVFIKLSSETLTVMQRGFVLTLFTCLPLAVLHALRQRLRVLRPKKPVLHLVRGGANAANLFCVVYALAHMPLASFYIIAFLSPLIITLAGGLLEREKVASSGWAALIAGFIGVVIAVNPQQFDTVSWPPLGVGAMLLANFALTVYAVTIKSWGKNETGEALAFYPEFLAAIIFGIVIVAIGEARMDLTGFIYGALAGCCAAVAVSCLTLAYQRAPNLYVAPFHYTQIISGAVLGYIIWQDAVTWHLVAGAGIIIVAGLYLLWHGSRQDAPTPKA